MLVLALDTSTAATSVALVDAERVLGERTEVAANRHGELLSPLVQEVVADAGVELRHVELLAVGIGPGPFTGLRVGLATAVSLADALGVPARGVCSLDGVAFAAQRPWGDGFAVVTDARRKEVYWAEYADDRRVGEPQVDRPAVVADRLDAGTHIVGAGAAQYATELAGHVLDATAPYPSAAAIARLAIDDAWWMPVQPMYLRRPDARPPGAPKRVTPA